MTKSRGINVLDHLLTSVLDAFPHPFYIIDVETYTIVMANKAAGPHIVPGESTCYRISHHRDAPCHAPHHPCPLREVCRRGEPVIVQHTHYDEHGAPQFVEVHAYPVRLPSGEIPYVVEICIDVTERHRVQQTLRQREAELSAALDATPVLVMIVDRERRIRRANRAVADLVGVPRSALYGQRLGNALRCIHASDDPRGCGFGPSCGGCAVRQLVFDTLNKGQPFYQREVTLEVERLPGVQAHTFWASSVPLTTDHEPMALLALEDITPLKNALARTRRLLAYQETLHEILASAAHAHDLPTLLENVLHMVLQTTGTTVGAIWVGDERVARGVDPSIVETSVQASREEGLGIGDPVVVSDLFRDELTTSLAHWAMRVLAPFHLRALLGVPILSEDRCIGGIGVASFEPVRWHEEDIVLLSTVGREVGTLAERLLLIERLRRVNAELEEALQVKDTVLQNVSHELRTPLTLIKGYTELMREGALGDLSPQQAHALEVMQRNIERLLFMINRLLLMRLIRGQSLEKQIVPVGQWLTALVEEWRPVAQEKGFDLRLDLASPLPSIPIDPQLFREVMDNLLHNAMKFSPEGGVIQIRAWQTERRVVIAVSDEGVGIPPDRLERVFDLFYQVDGGVARRFEGLGIGLTLCKQIVELHGGRIWAESEGEGKGTTIYVALPVGDDGQ